MTSTREDVRRILERSDDGRGFEVYSIDNATIDVFYSYGKCTDEFNGGWNVTEDIVVELNFTPLTDIKFSSINLNLKKFQKVQESPHVPEIITYINRDEGVGYEVQDGFVSTIRFFPSSKYDKLRCPAN